jgi:hypothetical protein
MNIEIFIFAFNRPDILEQQVTCLRTFLKNDFNINVVHDTRNRLFCDEFKEICSKLKVNYVLHESSEGLNPSQYHSDVLQWTYDQLVKPITDTIVLFLDHDMFLIEELNLIEEMNDYDIIGLLQQRGHVRYIWPGLVAFKTDSFNEINWGCGHVEGERVDTGGGTFTILKTKGIRFKDTGVEYPELYNDLNLKEENITFGYDFELHYGGKFLHSRNACNWDTYFNIKDLTKTQLLNTIITDVLNDGQK